MTTIMHKTYTYSTSGFIKYATNRFLRIYPIYWILLIITIVTILVTGEEFSKNFHTNMIIPTTLKEITANITLIFPNFTPGLYIPRVEPSTWALTIELFFYLLIGLGISRNKKITLIWFIASVSYTIYLNFSGTLGLSADNFLNASLPFSIGALLYYYKKTIYLLLKKISRGKSYLVLYFFLLNLVFSTFVTHQYEKINWAISFITSFGNLFLTVLVIILLLNTKYTSLKFKKIDRLAGDLSYPIYIFHWTGALLASWIFSKVNPDLLSANKLFFSCLIITLLISKLVNSTINKHIEIIRNNIKIQTNLRTK